MVETILIVDDDGPIRRFIRSSLASQGFRLLKACNGHEALSLAEDHRGPIDLLITDVVMPRMTGFTLAEELVESHPETRVLFVSGYADQSMTVRVGLTEAGQAILPKPFKADELRQSVRRVLDGDPVRDADATA